MNKVVAVVNQKGGTGKTTTTMNLGGALTKLNQRVLLIDADPQANLTFALGINNPKYTLADVLAGECSLYDAIIESGSLHVVPSSMEMADVELSLVTQEQREFYLAKALEDPMPYDFILIDPPPSLSLITVNVLNAASNIIIPMQLEVLTLQGLKQILATVEAIRKNTNSKLRVDGILCVNYDSRRKLSDEMFSFMKKNVDVHIFKRRIRTNVRLAEAPSFGKTVIDYAPHSKGARDYMAAAKEFLELHNIKGESKKDKNKYKKR